MSIGKSKEEQLIVALIVFAFLFLAFSYISTPRAVAVKTFEVKFIVGSNYGIDLDTKVLTFGKIVPGGSIQRDLQIKNDFSYPIRVFVSVSDNMLNYLSSSSNFSMSSGENVSLPIRAYVPRNTPEGEYLGEITLSMFKEK